MLQETMWNVFTSWFTPTTLFLLLNLMIATIFFTSGLGSNKSLTRTHQQHQHESQSQTEPVLLQRSPSVLQRLKSINLYHYAHYSKPVEPTHVTTSLQVSDFGNDDVRVHEAEESDRVDFDSDQDMSIEEVYNELQHEDSKSNFTRTRSDTEPASGTVPVKLVKKMKKSASTKSAFKHFSEAEVLEARRPATVREAKPAVDDVEVDSKADDFINKFKQQLKLQRLDSILRYKEMLGRGAGK